MKFLILIYILLPIIGFGQIINEDVIYVGKEKVENNKFYVGLLLYEICPGVTSISCSRDISILYDETLKINDFVSNKGILSYKLNDKDTLVLYVNFLGKSDGFWAKNFQIKNISNLKYNIKKRIDINKKISYQKLQFKTSEILVYKIKVEFLNRELFSRNIEVATESTYVTVYVIGGERKEMLGNKTSIHETEHINELNKRG
ncbi:hypothetical protein [Moheibacter stercoris]|uniref:Uncharacterized protein n=1 Tax=Moheibacter stercoris TaxID=1628251 RepID=A0ABV2LSP9_9FLAO